MGQGQPGVPPGADRAARDSAARVLRPAVSPRARRRGFLWLLAFAAAVLAFSVALARGGGLVAPVGRPAPPFALPDLNGRLVPLSRFAGGDVVLRFDSPSCTICDPPWTQLAAWRRTGGTSLRVVDIEVGQPVSVVRLQLAGGPLPVPVLVDASGGVALAYGVHSLPSVVFIDRRNDVVAVAPVVSRTGLWSTATWQHYVGLLRRADA